MIAAARVMRLASRDPRVRRAALRAASRDPRVRQAALRVALRLGYRAGRYAWQRHGPFKPKFKPGDIADLAAGYRYPDDAAARTAGASAGKRGYFTLEELQKVGNWKTANRQRSNLAKNTAEAVKAATKIALDSDASERDRLRALRGLKGVDAPVASALLHFADPDRWSILDWRILESLGVQQPPYYSYSFWESFQEACGEFAEEAGVSRRVFDKAGFVWSTLSGAGRRSAAAFGVIGLRESSIVRRPR